MVERLFQLPAEEQRNHHECWCHLQLMFCRSSWLAVCLEYPVQQEDKDTFALPTAKGMSAYIVKKERKKNTNAFVSNQV